MAIRSWSPRFAAVVLLASALATTHACAQASAPQGTDGPLPPTGINVQANPAARVKQFRAYLSSRVPGDPGSRLKKAILTKALDAGTLSPLFGLEIAYLTCADFTYLAPGWSEALAVALEPTFGSCYEQPNAPVVYDQAKLQDFIRKLDADFPNNAGNMHWSASFSDMVRNNKDIYLDVSRPYADAYRAEQQRLAAEQKQKADAAAKAARLAKMANPDILGIGLGTSREEFMAISAKGRDVWTCETDDELRSETCTGVIHREICVIDRTIAGDHADCRVIPDPEGAASPALMKVSTIVGQPVSRIVVSYYDRKIESIEFVMIRPPPFGRDETDYHTALREKFGEPEKGGYWEGEDSRLLAREANAGNESPMIFRLERPSVVAAKEVLVKSIEDAKRQAERQRQAELRKNL